MGGDALNFFCLAALPQPPSALSCLYWRIGKRIQEEILQGERAEYGKEILATLSQQFFLGLKNTFQENRFGNRSDFLRSRAKPQSVLTPESILL